MDSLKEYIINITAAAFAGVLCEIIMPGGDFKKYARLVCGMVLIMIIISPLAKSDSFEKIFTAPELSEQPSFDASAAERVYRQQVLKETKNRLEKKLETFAGGNASIELDDGGNVVSVTVRSDMNPVWLKEYIAKNYGAKKENISILPLN